LIARISPLSLWTGISDTYIVGIRFISKTVYYYRYYKPLHSKKRFWVEPGLKPQMLRFFWYFILGCPFFFSYTYRALLILKNVHLKVTSGLKLLILKLLRKTNCSIFTTCKNVHGEKMHYCKTNNSTYLKLNILQDSTSDIFCFKLFKLRPNSK